MKESVHLIQASVVLYGRSHFSLSIEARRLRHTLAAFPNPPESDMTRGVKEPCVLSLLLVLQDFIGTDLGTLMFPVCLR